MTIKRERSRSRRHRRIPYPIVNTANILARNGQLERELFTRPLNEMGKDWAEMVLGVAQNKPIPWNTLLLISNVSVRQRQQFSDVCREKTELAVSYLRKPMVPDHVVQVDFSSGPFDDGAKYLNNETFELFLDALGHITKLNLSLDVPSRLGNFVMALLTAWFVYNRTKPLLSLDIKYPPKGSLKDNEPLFWAAVCVLTSVRRLRVHNMPNFPLISPHPQLTHLRSLTVIDYRGDLACLLCQLGVNIRVLEICYNSNSARCGQPALERFIANNPAFGSNLVELRMHGNGLMGPERPDDLLHVTPRKWLQIATRHFPKLRTLILDGLGDMPINLLLNKLSLLRDLRNTTIDSDIQLLTPEMASNYDPFVNMKSLIFRSTAPTQYSFEQFYGTIPRLFPNLQAMVFHTEDQMLRKDLVEYHRELFPRMTSDELILL